MMRSLVLACALLVPSLARAQGTDYRTPDGAPGIDVVRSLLYDGRTGRLVRKLGHGEWHMGEWRNNQVRCAAKDTPVWVWDDGEYARVKMACLRSRPTT